MSRVRVPEGVPLPLEWKHSGGTEKILTVRAVEIDNPSEIQRSGFARERRHSEMREFSPKAEAKDMELVSTKSVLIAVRVHPFPSRTRQLSSLAPKILGWRRPGKIGSADISKEDR